MKPDRETQWVVGDYTSFLPENNKKSYQFRFLKHCDWKPWGLFHIDERLFGSQEHGIFNLKIVHLIRCLFCPREVNSFLKNPNISQLQITKHPMKSEYLSEVIGFLFCCYPTENLVWPETGMMKAHQRHCR